ncbi:hypothetical protein OH687_32660 [Burkholderia anthina]|nr:hypothetical protein OH687_32660 [Burkholderia anthina]
MRKLPESNPGQQRAGSRRAFLPLQHRRSQHFRLFASCRSVSSET